MLIPIPGLLVSIATFPGIIVHEFAHDLFCKLTKTPVQEVCYFQIGNPAGYVIHELPSNVWKHILIGIGPLIVNSLIGIAMGFAAIFMQIDYYHLTALGAAYLWLAISIAMHSFPSTGDADSIMNAIWSQGAPITARLLGTPLVLVLRLGAACSVIWLDAIYGFILVVGLPREILGL